MINLYPEITYQNLEGFGGAITDAAGYVYSEMNKEQQEQVVRMYFWPGEHELPDGAGSCRQL